MNKFLGIPYAAPPVGALRWKPPAPPAHHALLDATQFANTCPQVTELGAFAGPSSTNEDCLYLNVFTTGRAGRSASKPVLVWIHGGGNVDGETTDYDGSKLATGGPLGTPTVVVTHQLSPGPVRLSIGNTFERERKATLGVTTASWISRPRSAGCRPISQPSAATPPRSRSAANLRRAMTLVRTCYRQGPRDCSTGRSTKAPPSRSFPSAATALANGNAFAAAAGCSRLPRVCVACRPHGSSSCREHPMQVVRTSMASSWMEPSYPCSRKRPGLLGTTTRCPSWEVALRTKVTSAEHYRVFLRSTPGAPDASPIYGQQQRCSSG